MVLISSGENLCIRLPTRSDVLKTWFGVEVAAANRFIIVVHFSGGGVCRCGTTDLP